MSTKKKQSAEPLGFQEMLQRRGVAKMVRLAADIPDLRVESFSTGFPQLDLLINPERPGFPRGRDIELSGESSAGKTSLATAIAASAQRAGLSVCYADIEKTQTDDYFRTNGVDLDPATWKAPFAILRPSNEVYSAEHILDVIKMISNEDPSQPDWKPFDLIIVDSVGSLAAKASLERDQQQNIQPGRIASVFSDYLPKNTSKFSTIIWINQIRSKISSGPASFGGPTTQSMGGKAIRFFCSIRLSLARIETLKTSTGNVYGFITQVSTTKNKLGRERQVANMTYLWGEGFSLISDCIKAGIASGIVKVSGAWYSLINPATGEECVKQQGLSNFHQYFRNNPEWKDWLVQATNPKAMITEIEGTADSDDEEEDEAA